MGEGHQIFDLENEDNLEMIEQPNEDINDYFLKAFQTVEETSGSVSTLEIDKIEIELSDSIIRKIIEVMFISGWPQTINRPEVKHTVEEKVSKPAKNTMIKADLEGVVVRMRVKKDVSTFKVLGIKF